jgi:hypothetical protein
MTGFIKSGIFQALNFIPDIIITSPYSVFNPWQFPHGTFICLPAGLNFPLYNYGVH